MSALTVGLLGLIPGQPAAAAVGDRPVASWNMFGAGGANLDKWRTGVAYLAARADVVALQEAGVAPPPLAPGERQEVLTQDDGRLLIGGDANRVPPGVGRTVIHSVWQFGDQLPQDRHVYWLQTDRSAQNSGLGGWRGLTGHVNLAIVSSVPADQVAIVANPLATAEGNHPWSARAALGIRLGDTWYFTLHGMSGSGNDDRGLLQNIADFVSGQPLGMRHWIALGDYNRLPGNLTIPDGTQIYHTGRNTHAVFGQGSGNPRELDYAVGTAPTNGQPLVGRVAVDDIDRSTAPVATMSDHVPVFVGPFRAAAEPKAIYMDATVESMAAGGVLDALQQGQDNGTLVDSYMRNGQLNQRWAIQEFDDGALRFVGLQSGRCLDFLNAPTARSADTVESPPVAGEKLQLWDCDNGASQRWVAEYLGNDEYQLHNQANQDLCLNVSGGQDDVHKGVQTILWNCENTVNERWIFTPSTPDIDADSEPWNFPDLVSGPISLETVKDGGLMDVSQNHTAEDSLVRQFHRNGGANQGWYLDYVNAHTVTFRGVQSNRCLDIHNSNTAEAGRELVIWDCIPAQESQEWSIQQLRGPEVMLHSVAHPELCIDVFHDPQDPDVGNLDVYTCGSPGNPPANQTWILTSYDPTGYPIRDPDYDWDDDWSGSSVLITAGPGASEADLSSANRSAPVPGMPDWSHVGYLGGQPLPHDGDVTGNASCRITPEQLASTYQVIPDDGKDDTTGLQNAIDYIKSQCSPQAGYHQLSLISLPSGQIDVSRQMYADADFLIIRGKGSGDGGTKFVFRPDLNTRYDTLVNGRWDQDSMVAGSGSDVGTGGWMWPGRGMFRVQTRDVATRYQDDWAAAPANRKDIFEGSVNQHWASGIKLSAQANDPAYSARKGDNVIQLVSNAAMTKFTLGGYVWVGAANSVKFYAQQGVTDQSKMENLHMRQEMFQVVRMDATAKTITLSRPLTWDLPVDSTSDGSPAIAGTVYASKVTPLKVVQGVGFEDFAYTQDMNGLPKLGGGTYSMTPEQAVNNYGNMAPEYAMHGIVFKWAANDWARGLKATMTGSHPIVTEDALNLQIEGNSFDGSWNKGKGGNGYLRGSRVWQSLYAYNLSRNLRHFTFQWSASGNVAFRNDLDSDLNLHGGWEHGNLFEQNTVRVSYDHRSASCTANCGGEAGEVDAGTWYPIWWAAGPKAIKWSGSSGPQNVFYNNTMIKQTTPGGSFDPYTPYGTQAGTAFEFGSDNSDPTQFHPLSQDGQPIPDWTDRETLDYTGQGLVAQPEGRFSLFLR
ncbi:RICIN domain-containing protein [Streptomyces flaveolus]|uniref:RICIN domain-containing protein n=1 Tax=Streptomyces flaveolus TaxID=67297 RepID=UPI00343F80A4